MKIKDITNWSERWSTPIGTMEVHPTIADGVLVDLYWGTSIIGLAVQCSQNTKHDWPKDRLLCPKDKIYFASAKN